MAALRLPLDAGAQNPNEGRLDPAQGTLLYRTSRNFEYRGFHRLDLDRPVKVAKGQTIAVISTASTLNDGGARTYSVSANMGMSKDDAEKYGTRMYQKAVVNKGESFVYQNGQWQDCSDVIASKADPIDNFSIKLYADPSDEGDPIDEGKPIEKVEPKLVVATYGAHVQGKGDLDAVSDGKKSGTTGEGRRLEAIWAKTSEGSIEYRSHVQSKGWESEWVRDGAVSGTKGKAKRIEAIQMRYSGADDQHLWYRVHSQTYGWLGWASDGEPAGTANLGKRAEAIEVQVLPKGAVPEDYDSSRPAVWHN